MSKTMTHSKTLKQHKRDRQTVRDSRFLDSLLALYPANDAALKRTKERQAKDTAKLAEINTTIAACETFISDMSKGQC